MTFLPIPSLRWRLVLVMCLAYIVVSVTTLIVGYSNQLSTVHRQQETRARSDAQILASGAVAPLRSATVGGLSGVRALVSSLRNADGVSYAAIMGSNGCIIASTRAPQSGACPHLVLIAQPTEHRLSNGDVVGLAPIDFATTYDGAAEVIISGSAVERDLLSNTLTDALLRLVGLVIFLVLSLAIAQYILGPLGNLARGAEAIRRGDFGTRVPVQRGTELRTVGEAFNEMAISLERRIRHLTFLASSGPVLPRTLREHGDVRFALDEFCGQVEACAVGLFPEVESGEAPLWHQIDPDDADSAGRAERAASAVLETGRPVYDDPLVVAMPVLGDAAFVAVRDGSHPFDVEERQVITNFAFQLAVASDNAHLFEVQQEALAVKDQFLSIVSHELRTPLTTIKGYAQMLRKKLVNSATDQRFATNIDVQVDRLSRLVDDLLDVTRFARGQFELQRKEMDLRRLLEDAVARFRVVAPRHTIVLELDEGGIEGYWDRDRLEQVMNNLIGNAVKYSPDGGEVYVGVELSRGNVVITVRDQGIGIPEADQARLFERFYRGGAEAGDIQGLGLGLYVTHRIVEAHDGVIAVRSRMGEGSEFYFTLPLTRAPAPAASA